MREALTFAVVGVVGLLSGCRKELERSIVEAVQPAVEREIESALREILEGVRIDPERGIVEFDAEIAVDCHDPETPDVYLEVICCTHDTREHESLLVTPVPPSFVHAALLAVGAEPGSPGTWRRVGDRIEPVPPNGDRLRVVLLTPDASGAMQSHHPASWIVRQGTGRSLRASLPDTAWVFAGSRLREYKGREVYDADGTGQLIGLHTFGSETVAWTRVESPDSWSDDPVWLANRERVPGLGTPITVQLRLEAPPSGDSP